MFIKDVVDIFDGIGADVDLDGHMNDILGAAADVHWPPETAQFVLKPVHLGNGVVPIKTAFQTLLTRRGWATEVLVFPTGGPGKMDAVKTTHGKATVVEWETGNISSSHRALNKMTMAIQDGLARQGVLVMPGRETSYYLTDRIGNFEEIKPYLGVLRRDGLAGRLRIVVVGHDALDDSVPLIRKGTDGRALA